MYVQKDTVLNSVERKSFYSFLLLYIVSSFAFISLSAYWYYTAQETMLKSNDYYKHQHTADRISSEIIAASTKGHLNYTPRKEEGITLAFIDTHNKVVYGKITEDFFPTKPEYFAKGDYCVLVSQAPQEHLGIKYVVVQSKVLFDEIKKLKQSVMLVMFFGTIIMSLLAFVLSKLFMKPIHQHIQHIEDFIHDTTHELNTPITALSMSVSRAIKKKTYDEKILKNISISTKQLFDIYRSLTYLNFTSQSKVSRPVNVKTVLEKSVAYYKELSESKGIKIELDIENYNFQIDENKLSMLFGNLINNAIKYSMANSKIEISLKSGVFIIKDYGIGIEEGKIDNIFQKYNRQTEYAGGFGVGLSIVKKICDEYEIKLRVESKKEEGTRFILDFS